VIRQSKPPTEWGVQFPDSGTIYPCSPLVPHNERCRVTTAFALAAGLTLMYHDGRRWHRHDEFSTPERR